jgi:RNase P subunit RPR2
MSNIVALSSLKPHVRCPKCSSLKLERQAIDLRIRVGNGTNLCRLTERCIMCGWAKTVEDVKLGA